jgi:hypothetical protein
VDENVAIKARLEKPYLVKAKVCAKEKLKSKARLIMILQLPRARSSWKLPVT